MVRHRLITPSLASGVFAVLGAIAILGAHAWLYISEHQLFYDTLFGVNGFKTQLLLASDSFEVFRQRVFVYNPFTYYLFIGVVAIIAGLVLYTILDIITRAVRTTEEIVEEAEEGENLLHSEILARAAVRILGIVGWGVYIALFINIVAPYSMLAVDQGLETITIGDMGGIINILIGLAIMAASLHMHVVFARLCWLRIRLFGGDDFDY
jgi:hypothetical protein